MQLEQVALPSSELCPDGHAVHDAEPSIEVYPAAHEVQLMEPFTE